MSKDLKDCNTIGDRIRFYRKKAGLTQKELASRLYISQQMVANYENSSRAPKIGTIYKIANALKIPVTALLELGNTLQSELVSQDAISLIESLKDENFEDCIRTVIYKIRESACDGGFYFSDNFWYFSGEEFDKVLQYFDYIEDLSIFLIEKLQVEDSDDWSDDELKQINDYKDYILSKRYKSEN